MWFDELTRWVLTQMSPKHPNKQHVTLLWNVWSNSCGSVRQAFDVVAQIIKHVSANSEFPYSAVFVRPGGVTLSLSSVDEYSALLAASHGSLQRLHQTVLPSLFVSHSIPHEIGPYSNKPATKGAIRHAFVLLREIETFFAIQYSGKPMPSALLYSLQHVRSLLSFSANRYFYGGLAANEALSEVDSAVAKAATVLSLFTSAASELAFSLDDATFDLPSSLFETLVNLHDGRVTIRLLNLQSIPRHAVASFQVGFVGLCLEGEDGGTPHYQLHEDFDNNVWLFVEVDVTALGEARFSVFRCDNNQPFRSKRVPFDRTRALTRFGNPDFGVILTKQGFMHSVEIGGKRVEFSSQPARYKGGVERRMRTG